MRLLAVTSCLLALFYAANAEWKCGVDGGNKLYNFAGEEFDQYVPCKFKAIKAQTCGPWTVTISTGNVIDYLGKVLFRNIFIKVEDRNASSPHFEKTWSGFTNFVVAKKFVAGHTKVTQGFKSLFGSVGFGYCNVFGDAKEITKGEKGERDAGGSYKLTSVDGSFSVQYFLLDESAGQANRGNTSGFEFICNEDDQMNAYPDQMCGDDTTGVLTARKSDLGLDSENQVLMYDILTNAAIQNGYKNKSLGIEGPDVFNSTCSRLVNAWARRCDTQEKKILALKSCSDILMSDEHRTAISGDTNTVQPGDAMWYCVEFVCNNYKVSTPYCGQLSAALDGVPEMTSEGLGDKVDEVCGDAFPFTPASGR